MNKITNITLPRPNSWYYENGYLTIDLELFGKYLCEIFNKYVGEYYYFQRFTPTIRTDKERPIWQQGEERRDLAIISPILYAEDSWQNYNRIRVVPLPDLRPPFLQPFTLYYEAPPSLFSRAPLKLDEKEFLLHFGKQSGESVQIDLGCIRDGEFIPTDSFKDSKDEIIHSNSLYPFVDDFIRSIFEYKILNKKPIIDESDMEVILEEFGISRKEKLQTILALLKSMQEESTEILLGNNNVGDVLDLNRSGNKSR